MKITMNGMVVFLFSLLSACSSGDYRIVNVNIYKGTPAWELAKAVKSQDVQKIAEIAAKNSDVLNYQEPIHQATLLYWAVGMEKYDSAQALLKAGADPNIIIVTKFSSDTALCLAARYSFIDNQAKKDAKFVQLLLKHGADPNISVEKSCATPLMQSIGCGIEKTKALVEAGADINFKTEAGMNAVIQAFMHGGPNSTLDGMKYAQYLIVSNKADVTKSYLTAPSGEKLYPVNFLRNWIYPLDSDRHILKMEIVEECARQGADYWSTEITKRQLDQIKNKYPDTWEEYIKRY